jgi:hypothetical protein
MTLNVTPEILTYAAIAGASVFGVTWTGTWNAVGKVVSAVKGFKLPSLGVTPLSTLEASVAAIRADQVRALDKDPAVRDAFLAEADKYLASVRNLYVEAAQ